jgi:hypothetical protein
MRKLKRRTRFIDFACSAWADGFRPSLILSSGDSGFPAWRFLHNGLITVHEGKLLSQKINRLNHTSMKNNVISIAFSIISVPCLTAAVVSNTNITLSNIDFPGANYALTVFQDEGRNDPTSILINASGSILTFVTTNLDEASDWYLVSFEDAFSKANIQSNLFPVFVRTSSGFESNVLDVGFGSFYLGVNTGNIDGGYDPFPPRNLYGWVHLQNTGGSLTMLGNAMSYSGSGIVVGTTQAIPEPSSLTLLLGFFATTLWRRRT